jgi:hypothetical protein
LEALEGVDRGGVVFADSAVEFIADGAENAGYSGT